MSKYKEPHLEERITSAKKKAERVKELMQDSSKIETEEEFEHLMVIFISRHYNMPIYSDYFKERTLDELVYEAQMISTFEKTFSPEDTSNVIKNNESEANALADEMEQFLDATDQLDNTINEDDPFSKITSQFMETGEWFEGDPKND